MAASPEIDANAIAERTKAGERLLGSMNRRLRAEGFGMAIAKAEFLVKPGFEAPGHTIYASDHDRELGDRRVPDDARRSADGDVLTYLVVRSGCAAMRGVPAEDAEAAIDRSLESWRRSSACGSVELLKRIDTGEDATVADYFLGLGALGRPFQADIVNAGFVSGDFFDALVPNGSRFILGVTFTLIFMDEDGRPTDLDRNRKFDTALAEIYYNNTFPWSVNGSGGIDIETVALHENGHALGLAHFGDIFRTRNGTLHVAPRAVMNAAYLGPLQTPQRTDRSAICGLYANWP